MAVFIEVDTLACAAAIALAAMPYDFVRNDA
jgi:hypothetical protein